VTDGVAYNDAMQGMTVRLLAAGTRPGREGLHRRLALALLAMLGLLALPALPSRADPGDGAETARVATTAVSPSVGSNSLSGGGTHAVSGLTIPIVSMPQADAVIVHKGERRLYLMKNGKVLRSYRIALGLDPQGPKQREGDFRTPEGHYFLTRRNPRSDYFLSIQVSYPNEEDLQRAHRDHVAPGGSIMVHGLPNALSHSASYYAKSDWTDGCIALSDSDMVEVWLMTRDNTPIEILP
jgi:hypothetical protein